MLGVCDRNMKFLYVLAGWEGSASDSRVLRDAMARQDAFVVPHSNSLPWYDTTTNTSMGIPYLILTIS